MKNIFMFCITLSLGLGLFSCQNESSTSQVPNDVRSNVASKTVAPKTSSSTTETSLDDEVAKAIATFKQYIKEDNVDALKKIVDYPLKRKAPLPAVQSEADFTKRYAEIFDASLKTKILNGKWDAVGTKGIMLDSGSVLWLDMSGNLISINYESAQEATRREALLQKQKTTLHSSIAQFEKPIAVLNMKRFIVRVDDMGGYKYRYAAWKQGANMSQKPEIVLKNGTWIREGRGGDGHYEFKNGNYKYIVRQSKFGEGSAPSSTLEVLQGAKVVTQDEATTSNDEILLYEQARAKVKSTAIQLNEPTSSPDYKIALGDYLVQNEFIGAWKKGMPVSKLEEYLGKAEKVDKVEYMDDMGAYMGHILYSSKGISFVTFGQDKNKMTIHSISVSKPYALKTSRGIGIGSTKEEVMNTYMPHIPAKEYQYESGIYLGTYISGMHVGWDENGIVSSITLGVLGE